MSAGYHQLHAGNVHIVHIASTFFHVISMFQPFYRHFNQKIRPLHHSNIDDMWKNREKLRISSCGGGDDGACMCIKGFTAAMATEWMLGLGARHLPTCYWLVPSISKSEVKAFFCRLGIHLNFLRFQFW